MTLRKIRRPESILTIRERAIAAWPPAWGGQNQRDILVTLGYDIDKPWRDLPKKTAQWILFTDEQPTVPFMRGLQPAKQSGHPSTKRRTELYGHVYGRERYVLHTFATTHSALNENARFATCSLAIARSAKASDCGRNPCS